MQRFTDLYTDAHTLTHKILEWTYKEKPSFDTFRTALFHKWLLLDKQIHFKLIYPWMTTLTIIQICPYFISLTLFLTDLPLL